MESELSIKATKKFPSCHSSTICELPSGNMLATCYAGKKEGSEDSVVLGSKFDRKKGNWSPPKVWVNVAHHAPANPRVFTGPGNGEIWLLFGINYGRWCNGDTRLFIKRSYNEGRTWTDLELFTDHQGILGKNKPFHQNSIWVIPVENEHTWKAKFLYSEDNGQSWELVGNLGEKINAHLIQPTIVKTKDSTLMAYMRSQEDYIFKSFSRDMGKTWSKPQPTSLPNNNSGIDMVRLKSGNLVLVYNPTKLDDSLDKLDHHWPSTLPSGFHSWGLRTPLKLSLSKDWGKTWTHHMILENGPGEYSYPAVIQDKNGIIHITYTYRRKAIKHVKIREREILQQNGVREDAMT